MQNLRATALLCFLFTAFSVSAQNYSIMFQSGAQIPEANLKNFISDAAPAAEEIFNGYYYRFIQFNNIPDEAQKNTIEGSGIILLQYMPHKAFLAAIPANYNRSLLDNFNVRSVIPMEALHKMNKKLLEEVPVYARPSKGLIDIRVRYMQNIEPEDARVAATGFGEVIHESPSNYILTLRVSESKVFTIALQPWVYYLDAVAPPSIPDDTKGRSLHRSNVINADYPMGRHYNGSGVAAALADDGLVGPHIDFTGRITNHLIAPGGSHGDMTSGILAGSGNLNPVIRGMADGVQLHVFDIDTYPQIVDAVQNNVQYGTVVSSTSYSQGCNEYTTDSQFGDQTIYDNPQLEFVFSAGNNQNGNCSYGAGAGWGVITGGYKQGKNVITVANLNAWEGLDPSSSRGPASDGRIKPDISSNGRNQLSTNENNTYQTGGGTSAACPGIAGICTQLIQAYKELNAAPDAPTALIKACLLNGAEDIGNPGPDYTYGYGRVNSLRAVQTLEDNRYLNATVSQNGTNMHTIIVPSGVLQLRVMIYWHDVGGNPAASTALINDLDMTVTDPSSTVWNPWVLNPAPNVASITAPAVRNPDHLNNMEQVTIDNPAAGNYSVNVNGYAVPQGPQQYYLVYEFRTNAITVTYPMGGEGFVPLESEVIRWDAPKGLGPFTLEYSIDNGSTWLNIVSNLSQDSLHYTWTVPNNITGQARIRVSRGAVSGMSAEKFSIIGTPASLMVNWACPDSIRLSWNPVSGAAWYEISRLGTYYMDSIGTSVTSSFVDFPVNGNFEYWYGCRAVFANGSKGRRCISIYKSPGVFACPFTIDAGIVSVDNPTPNALHGCPNLATTVVSVTIKNGGANSISNIPVYYSLNNGVPVNEVYTGTIAPFDSVLYDFMAAADLSGNGTYTLKSWTGYPGDQNIYSDSSSVVLSVAVISSPVIETMESFNLCSTVYDCGTTVCPLDNAWVNQSNLTDDDIDFRTNEGATPSGNTGPNADHTFGNNAGNYIYLEASNGCNFEQANLISPCIDLNSVDAAQMTFWYHMYGAGMGELHADVYVGNTWMNDVIPPITGNQGNQWLQGTIDLMPYAGNTINIRFRGITGSDYTSDLALDDINIDVITKVNSNLVGNNISVFPNPSSGIFNITIISGKSADYQVSLYDINGRIINNKIIGVAGSYSGQIDLRNFSKGVYWLGVKNSDGVYRKRLVVI